MFIFKSRKMEVKMNIFFGYVCLKNVGFNNISIHNNNSSNNNGNKFNVYPFK